MPFPTLLVCHKQDLNDLPKKEIDTKKIVKLRDQNIHWNLYPSNITPAHLYFSQEDKNKITDFLNDWLVKLCICYLSSYVDYDKNYICTFKGKRNLKVHLINSFELDRDSIDSLYLLYEWVYSENTTDKLSLVQNIVSMHINYEELQNTDVFLSSITEIREVVVENFKVYIHQSIDDYLDKRRQFEDLIKYTADQIGKQINSISSIMTKNLFGILATAFTAVLSLSIRQNVNLENNMILPLILYIYGGFIIILNIYYSFFTVKNINIVMKNYQHKKENEFTKYFSKERIKLITGEFIQDQKKLFNIFLWITVILNLLISLSSIFLGVYFQSGFNIIIFITDLISKSFATHT